MLRVGDKIRVLRPQIFEGFNASELRTLESGVIATVVRTILAGRFIVLAEDTHWGFMAIEETITWEKVRGNSDPMSINIQDLLKSYRSGFEQPRTL